MNLVVEESPMENESPKVEFEGGALRSKALPLYDKLDKEWQKKVALALSEGELKYPTDEHGVQNWQKGEHDFLCEIYRHAYEHLLEINPRKVREEGYDFSEDHFGHCAANLMFLSWYFDQGRYLHRHPEPTELDNYELGVDVGNGDYSSDSVPETTPAKPNLLERLFQRGK